MKLLIPAIQFMILTIIIIGMGFYATDTMDNHMYKGINIVGSSINPKILTVTFDEIVSGTDWSCVEAAKLLQNVAKQSGYKVKVISKGSEWVPMRNKIWSYEDLTKLINNKNAY